jgi:hypothetical protein
MRSASTGVQARFATKDYVSGTVASASATYGNTSELCERLFTLKPAIGVVTTGLVAEYVGKFAKNGTAPGNNSDPTSMWDDTRGTYDLGQQGNAWTTASGWCGAGTVADPYAWQGDGVDGAWYGNVAPIDVDGQDWSAEGWAFVPASPGENISVVEFNHSTGAAVVEIYVDSSGYPHAYYKTDAGNVTSVDGPDVRNGWHHFVMTHHQSDRIVTLYVDGTSVGTPAARTNSTTRNSYLMIGAYADGLTVPLGNYWPGKVSTVRVYNRALTSGEVAQNYAAGVLAASTDMSDRTCLIAFGIC